MDDPQGPPDEPWAKKDAGIGLLFLGMGFLLVAFVVLTFVRGSFLMSPVVYVLGGLLGLLLGGLGANAVWRAVRAK